MMNRSLIRWLIAVILPMLVALLPAESLYGRQKGDVDPIDSALERYAAICNRCLDLKELAAAGKEVPLDEFQALLQELSALKSTLQGGSGKMTDVQRLRFSAIRDSYAASRHFRASGDGNSLAAASGDVPAAIAVGQDYRASGAKDSLAAASGDAPAAIAVGQDYRASGAKGSLAAASGDVPAAASDSISKQQATLFASDAEQTSAASTTASTSPAASPTASTAVLTTLDGTPTASTAASTSLADISEKRARGQLPVAPSLSDFGVSLTMMASLGVWPDRTYGLMAAVDRGRWGAFLRGQSNFNLRRADYCCLASDGTTPYGHIWTTGNCDRLLTAVTAGGVYKLFDNLSIYAGAGYGHMNLFWEDTAGKWALVDDLSGPCVAAGGGILLHFGQVAAGIGVTSFGFDYANMELSLGWRF